MFLQIYLQIRYLWFPNAALLFSTFTAWNTKILAAYHNEKYNPSQSHLLWDNRNHLSWALHLPGFISEHKRSQINPHSLRRRLLKFRSLLSRCLHSFMSGIGIYQKLFDILSNKVLTTEPDKDIIASIAWKRRHLMVRAVECSNHIELRILLRMRAHLYRCKWANLIWLSFYLFASCCYLFCYHLYKINVLHT